MTRFQAVIGLGFGDEGKGIVTDYLCSKSKNALVMRFSGGQQAGHTVMTGGMKHTFSNYGSGTLRGVPTHWTNFCTVDPMGIYREAKVLVNLNVNPVLTVHPNCPVTTPYDKAHNQTNNSYNKHGTCGVGVGATWAREEKHYSLVWGDLYNKTVRDIKLDMIRDYYGDNIHQEERDKFIGYCDFVTDLIPYTSELHAGSYDDIIFEGSQGILLDQDIGFFPHVTRSNTDTTNIEKLIGDDPKLELYLVTRAYQTRHGNGPMTNEVYGTIINNRNETNLDTTFQGKFRKSVLDIDLLMYAKQRGISDSYSEHQTTLVITCLDHIEQNWFITYRGGLINFQSEDKFVEFISDNLGIEKVIRVRSPVTEDIKE